MTAALVTRPGLPGALSAQGYVPPADLTFPELMGVVEMAELIVDASPWWLVDAVAAIEERYPVEYLQALPEANDGPEGARKAKLKQAGWMADRWPAGTRVPGANFTHHRIVAKMERPEAVGLLQAAVAGSWSTRDLAREVDAREHAVPAASTPVESACAADRPLSLDDLLPEWRERAHNSGQPLGYLAALLDTMAEACFSRWED
jgi:hypothetical protein